MAREVPIEMGVWNKNPVRPGICSIMPNIPLEGRGADYKTSPISG